VRRTASFALSPELLELLERIARAESQREGVLVSRSEIVERMLRAQITRATQQ
jgi:metal-responsive CopG/Arc/MetJ family transcriptional regulator